ncbi:MAGUK p55 subfamily member 7 isoform X2 [Macrosteles quadrilineatus]|uniref:MAGUK p55 subfamily member 7 isoform X2 n=1 Tax=Macrosteles quadrilineatus TaxID=74068 RepID=UPI0023E18C78|nr:MAGUK p55 subfamily member 7 isoform X2 [Macrosteles quadrilineatus]
MTVVMASTNWDPALSGLLGALEESKQNLPSSEEEFGFLSGLLQSKELHALVKVHNKIIDNGKDEKFHPILSSSMQIALEVLDVILPRVNLSEDCKELFILLQKPHLQGLLCAHDAVAQKDYFPRLPEIPLEVDEDEETIKIVQLVKSNEPLGATIKTDEETGKIVIARVMHGGAADRSGLIHVGDEVVEVNNINVEGKTPNDVLKILQASEGTITFKLVPAEGRLGLRESKVRVRAHFDYFAFSDPYIPCKEAGLDFRKGDILHIVSQDDAYWWQARKEGDRDMRAGLIPSRALQERRILHERANTKTSKEGEGLPPDLLDLLLFSFTNEANPGTNLELSGGVGGCVSVCYPVPGLPPLTTCSVSPPKLPPCQSRTKKILYSAAEREDFDREEVATYEEVAKLYPRPGLARPIVLIGASGVGRNELRRRLIATDPEKYRTPVPYTSRPPRPGEVNGKEYFFVTRDQLEDDINAGKLLEYGEYKGNLYGTSGESVQSIVNAGYVCILNPHYQALRMLRTPQLKPFIIFIKPPAFEFFKETRNSAHARSTFDENNSRGFTDEEFAEIIHSSDRIEFMYSHLFDETIINADLSAAFERLVSAVIRVETDPLWVPTSWVQ